MTDKKLIEKAQKGDRDAFAALVQEWYEPMFRMAYKWCGHRQDAEDIVQNACIKLARSIGQFQFKSEFSSWLYRLVLNTGIDMKRAKKEDTLASEDGFVNLVAPASSGEDQLYAREMLAYVYELPETERTAIILVIGEGMSHKEAAEIMDCKESTVSWHIHEARKKLQNFADKERRHG